ncbi:MAG: hypothetical protein M0D57_11665 [Sphingobacteriales bacterium JAD_PAG50586_3]|nr:MAG: hypothetical protein M0D57_11665 [Sphingobacteriales bacterium JAD_PAG50586_3]
MVDLEKVVHLQPRKNREKQGLKKSLKIFQKRFGGSKKGCTFAPRNERETLKRLQQFFENIEEG